jgi:hypothetical protein
MRFLLSKVQRRSMHSPKSLNPELVAMFLDFRIAPDQYSVIDADQFGSDRNSRLIAEWRTGEVPMNKKAKTKAQMATFAKLIQDIDSRYRLGPKAGLLVQETLGLTTGRQGGIGAFLNRFKAAGFAAEVASWLGGPDPVPLTGER